MRIKAAEFDLRSVDSVIIASSIFKYNVHLLKGIKSELFVNFWRNKVEYSLDKCIEIKECANVQINENLFENNYDLKMYRLKPEAEWSRDKKMRFEMHHISKMLTDEKKMLISVDRSTTRIINNCFFQNNGLLVHVRQSIKKFGSSMNLFKFQKKEAKGRKKQPRFFGINNHLINQKSIKNDAELPNIEEKKQNRLMLHKSQKPSKFRKKMNKSEKKKLTPTRIKKRIPSHRLFNLQSNKKTGKKKRKLSNQSNYSYLSILEKQSNFIDSK